MTLRTGQCLCGTVRFEAETTGTYAVCYCKMCQRWASGVFMGAQTSGFEVVEGQEDLAIAKTSEWARRAFCRKCGSNIYYDAEDQAHPNVSLGTFDDIDGLHPMVQYFIDKKPADLPVIHDVKTMTETEVMEYFGGNDG